MQVLFLHMSCLGKIFHGFEVPSNVFPLPDIFIELFWDKVYTMGVQGGGTIPKRVQHKNQNTPTCFF